MVVDDIITEDCINFTNYILPAIMEYLKIDSAPFIQFCPCFDRDDIYGLYKFDTKELFICANVISNMFKCKNYGELFLHVASAITHELTHYKQDIENRYSYEQYLNDYKNLYENTVEEYINQDIEREAYNNQFDFIKNNRMHVYILAGTVLNQRLKIK